MYPSSKFTNALVALKLTQLAATISPTIEITPDDLFDVETVVSCFLKLSGGANTDSHFGALVAILEEWEGLFMINEEVASLEEASNTENNWSNDDWDEGWESFQDAECIRKDKKHNSLFVHPLHICWTEIFKHLISTSQYGDVFRMIDQSLSKSIGVLLDQNDAKSLNKIMLWMDPFLALKMLLLLPYEGIHLQSLNAVEGKLKQKGISQTISMDHEFLLLMLTSGIVSTTITKSSYGPLFSYLCYFSRQFQETKLSKLTKGGRNECRNTSQDLQLFIRVLFPVLISELVKADHHILAGFLTKLMHTNASLSIINIAESSLSKYLEKCSNCFKTKISLLNK